MSPKGDVVVRVLALIAFAGWFCPAVAGPWRAGEGNVSGWQWMSPDERVEHQRRLRTFDSHEACAAYVAAHHAVLEARARRAGVRLEPHQQTVCDQLRAEGRLR